MKTTDLTIATVNFMTPEYVEVLCKSLMKTNRWVCCDVQVYDNGTRKTLTQGQHNMYYVHHISDVLYDEFSSMPAINDPGWRNYASAKHAKTLQYIIDTTETPYLLMLDTDIVFTGSFERLFHVFSTHPFVMCGYIKKPQGYADRMAPWCTFLNLELTRKLGLRYYDANRMLYVNGNMTDDTGAAMLADCRKYGYPILEIPCDNGFYYHYKGGSYSDRNRVHQWLDSLRQYWS